MTFIPITTVVKVEWATADSIFMELRIFPDQSQTRLRRNRRIAHRGVAVVYFLAAWTVLIGFCSLAVDFGRVLLDKEQLQSAADAAARAALFNLPTSITAAQTAAVNVAAGNTVDGSSVAVDPNNDVAFGTWDPVAQTFTALTGTARSSANAVQVTAKRVAANSNAVPLLFASAIGRSTCDTKSTGIACKAANVGLTNADFESPALGSGNYTYDCSMPGWTLNGAACLNTYGSGWNPPHPNGSQSMSLQGNPSLALANISQTFTAIAGTYSISFLAAERPASAGGAGGVEPIAVSVDGVLIATISVSNTSAFAAVSTPNFALTTGSHTLTMAATDKSADKTTFVDSIAINVVSGPVFLAH